MNQLSLRVKGMDCASCALTVEKKLSRVKGVDKVTVNYATEKADIELSDDRLTINELNKTIKPLGYELEGHNMDDMGGMDHMDHMDHGNKTEKLAELAAKKNQLLFVLPLALIVFAIMMWQIAAQTIPGVSFNFLPMTTYSMILFILSSVVIFWIGRPFLKGVVTFIRYREANMDTLIGIGTLAAYLYSTIITLFPQVRIALNLPETDYFDVTIVVIGFVSLGKYLESRSKLMTGEAIEKLLNLQAKTALVLRDGKEIEVPIQEVVDGDIVSVKPGGKIPVDGVITEGASSIDEAMVSGEPIPVDKGPGDQVIGGTINKQGAFRFKATKVGSETLLANIIKMVEQAQGSRAPIQKLADRISGIFVPVVLIIAVVTLAAWLLIGSRFLPFDQALSSGLLCFVGVLVIACPCALGLATPTAIIVGVGKGAENGILIKNAESLEKLHKVDTVVVDKTGTVTSGKPEVSEIIPINYGELTEKEVLGLLASLENNSEHPLAQAITAAAKRAKLELYKTTDFKNLAGSGLSGTVKGVKYYAGNEALMTDLKIKTDKTLITRLGKEGKTPVLFSTDKTLIAMVAIADKIKDNCPAAVAELHRQGVKVVMLTGDNKDTAEYIAAQAGIDQVFAQVLPQDKANKIKELQAQGRIVAMAGDGINDAPALAQSDVGIAMGTGTDVAIESADITLLKGDISKIPQALKLSRNTMNTIKQNLFWAFFYNLIGIPLAAGLLFPFFGILLNPVFAGLAMALSSVSVVTNSLRLKLTKI